MLVTACASWLHWDTAGTEQNRAIADRQIAHAQALESVADDEDRELIASQIATIPQTL